MVSKNNFLENILKQLEMEMRLCLQERGCLDH